MTQSQNRYQKRIFKQLFNNSQQSKISNRYISKLEEYKKLSFEELDQFAKDVYNKTIKLSKTDKEALYEVYRPLVFQKAMERYLSKEESKTESNG
jgi:hypothetical protein